MKCKNCNCQVSSDFKHSFTTNICPKCGQTLMKNDVKDLFLKMSDVLSHNDNDIGDLAIWFVDTYLKTSTTAIEEVELPKVVSETSSDESTEEVELPLPKPKKPAVKVNRSQSQTADKEHSLLSADRTKLFSKRAGVDKIKYETLIKDIQGGLTPRDSSDIHDSSDIGDDAGDFGDFNETPLSNREMQSVAGLFETPDNSVMNYSEIEKIQKLEQLAITGSVGKIRRSS